MTAYLLACVRRSHGITSLYPDPTPAWVGRTGNKAITSLYPDPTPAWVGRTGNKAITSLYPDPTPAWVGRTGSKAITRLLRACIRILALHPGEVGRTGNKAITRLLRACIRILALHPGEVCAALFTAVSIRLQFSQFCNTVMAFSSIKLMCDILFERDSETTVYTVTNHDH